MEQLRVMQQKSKMMDQQSQEPTQVRKATIKQENTLSFNSDYYIWLNFHFGDFHSETSFPHDFRVYLQAEIKHDSHSLGTIRLPIISMQQPVHTREH